jgi:hypothetical protein
MRSVFYLLMSCLVLRAFFPLIAGELETALLGLVDLAGRTISAAQL